MKRLNLEQKALRVIEWLVSDDLSESCSMKSASGHNFTQEEAKSLSDKVTKIYTISHSAIPEHSCYEAHTDWRSKTLSTFRRLRREGGN